MNFLLYYILRKLFVKLKFSDNEIFLEKGILVKRAAVLPLSAIVQITSRRTVLMRVFRAKEITVFTLGGKLRFFLSQNEPLPFLPIRRSVCLKPRFREVAFGAFIDTRALGGIFVFSAVLRRISTVFGGEYFNRIITAITDTANELERTLRFFRITVPKIAVTAAVFALGAWVFAYFRKLMRLSHFRVSQKNGFLFVQSGSFTLYEHALVLNSASAVYCDTFTTLFAKRAPLYLRGVMVAPCVKRERLPKTLNALCGFKMPKSKLSPPKRATLGYVAAPLVWLGVFAAAIFAVYLLDFSSELLKIALYCGFFINLYAAALYLIYMRHSGVGADKFVLVSARRGLRLYTAVFPPDTLDRRTLSQSVFQKRAGFANLKLFTVERLKLTARQLPKDALPNRLFARRFSE